MTKTSFGFKQVETEEKQGLVNEVFHDVASQYDLMNDLMSFGLHRIWKWLTCYITDVNQDSVILDLAGGTGDLTRLLSNNINKNSSNHASRNGQIILADINNSMLSHGRDKLIDYGYNDINYTQLNAECLPFADNTFDLVTMAFGLRNVTNKDKALASIYRVLKPGGRLFVLEFSKPRFKPLAKLYDLYSFNIIPQIGKFITDKPEHYQYLAESIRMHPDQDLLKQMFLEAGFDDCEYHNFHSGIVALHRGYKY